MVVQFCFDGHSERSRLATPWAPAASCSPSTPGSTSFTSSAPCSSSEAVWEDGQGAAGGDEDASDGGCRRQGQEYLLSGVVITGSSDLSSYVNLPLDALYYDFQYKFTPSFLFSVHFYRTQVSLGSDLWVRLSLTEWVSYLVANSTDVTLPDGDTKPILTDNANRAIQGNVAMHVTHQVNLVVKFLTKVVPSGGKIWN